ncbi:MAG: class II fructose-bisphosphate aldolase [Candidatus Buchananbacteria bacterium]
MLVKLARIVKSAQKHNYAVAAFNVADIETVKGVILAAVAQKSPVIIQASESTINYTQVETIADVVKDLAKTIGKTVPIALHLDHGHSLNNIKAVLRNGFSSVMLDASAANYQKNINLTKKAVQLAHHCGAWAQGELGTLQGSEDKITTAVIKSQMTDPALVREFVGQTGVDVLAVSIGNIHGLIKMTKLKAKLDLKRLKEINQQLPGVPLVLHGASGLPAGQLIKAFKLGVKIINIDTEIRLAFTKALDQSRKTQAQEYDLRKYFAPAILAVQKVCENKIKLLGSANKAKFI